MILPFLRVSAVVVGQIGRQWKDWSPVVGCFKQTETWKSGSDPSCIIGSMT